MPPESKESDLQPIIRRGRLGSLTIHEVDESELTLLERGSPESIFLTFGVFLLSSAISFTVVLTTIEITSNRTFEVYVILTILFYIIGALCMALWLKLRVSVSKIIKGIRARLPAENGEAIQIK